MIDELSIIMPCEKGRIPLFIYTLGKYLKHGIKFPVEFVIVSRTIDSISIPNVDIKLVKYEWEGKHFNPALALNLGVKNSKYKNVMITCPEVYPVSNVLEQFSNNVRGNYVCQVYDQDSFGQRSTSLVNSSFRNESPAMYFMAIFKKEDIKAINGWDLNYMGGYAFEDNDFGIRFVHKGLKFSMKDSIVGEHQFHTRHEAESDGWKRNKALFHDKKNIVCERGLKES